MTKELVKSDFVIKKGREKGVLPFKNELIRLIDAAQAIIDEGQEILPALIKSEEYFKANEVKTVIAVNTEYIYRLTRIVEGFTAFETDDIMIYQMQDNNENIR